MSRKQLENIFRTPPASIPIHIPISRPRTSLELDVDELEKLEMAENTWYQWYDWLINHIPESMKKSKRDTKQTVMSIF